MYYSVTQHGDSDYILLVNNSSLAIIKDGKKQYVGMADDIHSAVCDDKRMLFTKKDSSNLYISNFTDDSVQEIRISSITSVVKLFGHDLRYLAFNDCNSNIRVFDLLNMETIFVVPLKKEFLDISCTENGVFTVIGENKYWDDNELEWVYEILRRFTYTTDGELNTYSAAYAKVFMDTFRDVPVDSYASYKGGIKLPLFDRYFQDWPRYKKVTPHLAIHYCSDIGSMIVSSLENGNVICMFKLPDGIKSSDCISFNEESFILTVLDPGSMQVTRYQVMLDNAAALEEMNIMYNKAYERKTWLRQNEKFERLVLEARAGCKLTRLS